MRGPRVTLAVAALLGGCLSVARPDPPAPPSAAQALAARQDVFHDPVLLTGGAGLILTLVGAVAGLVACQTENCIGTIDPTQVNSPQVQIGYPVMAIGLALGLPLYVGAWIVQTNREEARRRQQLLRTPIATGG